MEIRVHQSGSFGKTEKFLGAMSKLPDTTRKIIDSQARAGVAALKKATPRESGLAAESWSYKIASSRNGVTVTWINTDIEKGFPVAIALQLGYATGTGGWVQGRDYINPAIKPIFEKIAQEIWKAVTSS